MIKKIKKRDNPNAGLFATPQGTFNSPLDILVDFNGRYQDYNFVAKDGKILLADLKAELKQLLTDTDYKIIKCAECQLLELDAPYDVAELQRQRQGWREQINELEAQYAD